MLFVLFFLNRILKYAYLLRHVACFGYKKRIILSIDNEWFQGKFWFFHYCGVEFWGGMCERGGVFGVPHWWLWGVGGV